jgi:hypothetical protein
MRLLLVCNLRLHRSWHEIDEISSSAVLLLHTRPDPRILECVCTLNGRRPRAALSKALWHLGLSVLLEVAAEHPGNRVVVDALAEGPVGGRSG